MKKLLKKALSVLIVVLCLMPVVAMASGVQLSPGFFFDNTWLEREEMEDQTDDNVVFEEEIEEEVEEVVRPITGSAYLMINDSTGHVTIEQGETASLYMDCSNLLSSIRAQDRYVNHCVANIRTTSRGGGEVVVSANERALLDGGVLTGSVTAVSGGQVVLSITVTAGYSTNPNANSYSPDQVYGTASASIQITVPGGIVEAPEVVIVPEKEGYFKNPLAGIDPYAVPNPFSDITPDHWAYEAVMRCYAAGLLNGVDISPAQDGSQVIYMNKTYKQGGEEKVSMTVVTADEWIKKMRLKLTGSDEGAQLMKLGAMGATLTNLNTTQCSIGIGNGYARGNMVHELYNKYDSCVTPALPSYNCLFKDVPPKLKQSVGWAAKEGVVKGFSADRFEPTWSITREQFCTIILRYANEFGIPLRANSAPQFVDNDQISDYAKEAVAACQQNGLVQGVGGGRFDPKGIMTFDACQEIINNFCNVYGY
ncbi:MAG: S-layer homology domain-containing protein [Oscillospiraceae bacterium]|nr:S-layer homology domain-containing protein [Oscillospiraceae bacterium]